MRDNFLLKVIEAYVDHYYLRQELIVAHGSLAVAEARVIHNFESLGCYFEVAILSHSHINQGFSIILLVSLNPSKQLIVMKEEQE